MKDEDRSVIRLLSSNLQNGVTFYRLQITHRSKLYTLTCRYSKLRTIAPLLPQTTAKFPQTCHLTMAFSSLIGSSIVVKERYQKLTKYFEEVSRVPQLAQNKGFKRLLEQSVLLEESVEKCIAVAPRICGRKMMKRQLGDQLLIVIDRE